MYCPCGNKIIGHNKIEDYCRECNKAIKEYLIVTTKPKKDLDLEEYLKAMNETTEDSEEFDE